MAEQISFYDKLKSDMSDDIVESVAESPRIRAATQFATDYDLGADRPALVKSLQQRVQEVADSGAGSTRMTYESSTYSAGSPRPPPR